ncbi:hypothetical protein EGC86_18450 [Shewanella frigidimarina]|uniref:hypothetical protein n=1 Tax=Shewanella frigidimarina TaxID=56812 RepID=UPI000F515EA5|nr:hypothetical protein [Shewanella frigidimarina]RPA58879.1 hypothetical protein EGC86_18450 [Shewanella frigidimarina]
MKESSCKVENSAKTPPNNPINGKVVKYWLLKLGSLLSAHYVMFTSLLATIFTILCYWHAESVFEQYGLNFLYFASISDIYSIALSTGVISASIFKAIILSIIVMLAVSIPKANIQLKQSGKFGKVLKWLYILMLILLCITFYFILSQKHQEQMTRPLEPEINKQVARYTLLSSDSPSGRGCVGIISGTTSNIITWNYKENQVEIIPRSRVTRTDLMLRAPMKYVPNFIKRGQSQSERLQELKWIKANNLEWTKLLKKKCNETVELHPMLEKEIARINNYLN